MVFRGKVMAALGRAYDDGAIAPIPDAHDPQAFAALMRRLPKRWNVYAKAPFNKGSHVLAYLGRYTHRVGIANSRLLAVSERAVTFRTKGQSTETLSPVDFLGRFVQHVLPDGLHKIRHVGLYAPASAARRELARERLGHTVRARPRRSWRERLARLTGRDVAVCPHCGGRCYTVVVAHSRDPPLAA